MKFLVAGLFAVAMLAGVSQSAQAQNTDTIRKDVPFTVIADHDAVDTDAYNLYQNGVKVQTKTVAQAFLNGTVTFDKLIAGLAKGTYVFYVEAVGPGGFSVGNTTLTLTVTPNPPKSTTNIRIIKE